MELDAWLEPYRLEWANRLDSLEQHLARTSTRIDRTIPDPTKKDRS
jgi:hypothetical protein